MAVARRVERLTVVLDNEVVARGLSEAGARHGRIAIEAGHHLVLVSKEVDSVVGPYLAHLARQQQHCQRKQHKPVCKALAAAAAAVAICQRVLAAQ